MEEKFIEIRESNVRYIEKGGGDPLVLIHGLGASLEWWKYNLDFLSERRRVISLDIPGFGLSEKAKFGPNLESAGDFMMALLDALGIRKASLAGNSMGGLIALYAAFSFPERVDRLILVDNAGFGWKLTSLLRLASVRLLGEMILSLRFRPMVKAVIGRMFSDPGKVPEEMIDSVLKMFGQPGAASNFLRALRQGINLKGLKKEIVKRVCENSSCLTHRTLIIWGKNDLVIPVAQAYVGRELIKNSSLRLFENCGHVPQVERPDEFNRTVSEFLSC